MNKQTLKQYIPKQMRIAQKLGLNFIEFIEVSPLKLKKYRVFLTDGSHVDYGHVDYEDYLQHKDETRRRRFMARWMNNPNINNIHSPVFYITRLTW